MPFKSRRQQRFRPARQIGVGGLELGSQERKYLQQVIDSNRLSYGPFSRRFEALFAENHDCRFATFCSSGTAALHLALAALKERNEWKDGDEIILPAVTFVATGNTILHNNLKPVFVDVDARTYNIDPGLIEPKITARTRAILVAHLLGLPCDMEPIWALAQRHGLKIIEDSCETMFATYKGRKVGSLGAIGCFSTYIAHFIVAGVGGFTTTNDPELDVIARSLMNHGRDNIYLSIDDDQHASPEQLRQIVARRFSFVRLGHNFRATELEAAIGLAQLERKDDIIRKRQDNAAYFMRELHDLEEFLQLPFTPSDRDHMFMLFPLVLRHQPMRELVNFLEERLIETRDLLPLITQPIYRRKFGELANHYPVAKWLSECGFYIGCHQYLTNEERAYVVETIHEFFRR
jgi:dTDP-4-amino-4,6-dideoxygalactose transaminase